LRARKCASRRANKHRRTRTNSASFEIRCPFRSLDPSTSCVWLSGGWPWRDGGGNSFVVERGERRAKAFCMVGKLFWPGCKRLIRSLCVYRSCPPLKGPWNFAKCKQTWPQCITTGFTFATLEPRRAQSPERTYRAPGQMPALPWNSCLKG
jgi:hypothetical protein